MALPALVEAQKPYLQDDWRHNVDGRGAETAFEYALAEFLEVSGALKNRLQATFGAGPVGQHHGDDLAGAQRLTHAGPRRVHPLPAQRVLDGAQQVAGEHVQENVGAYTADLTSDSELQPFGTLA